MAEINLLKNYPVTKRNLDERIDVKTEEVCFVARQFGKDFFDGDRKYGYGGYSYHPRFWQPVVPDFQKHYDLSGSSSILDVGCGKGFMLYDFVQAIPGIKVEGIDISSYAIQNAKEEVKSFLKVANATSLPYEDNSFDLVVSINTVHNLDLEECQKAICEIHRVSKKNCFITVDAYRTSEEKKRMDAWNLTAKTYMSVDEWKEFFKQAGYQGDYFWFIP
ncbi:MAG: class I SAM-dependent methyltransferase [Candidatus Omnitrophica bacterium]|nr:class I SAM-dependent methyltransferase [Candidatus Omnitrophota bacterium]